ncbi:MAG TPA: hypothetical protein PKW80_04250 [Bacteroidales bacterium]|nr:hypothetical protein [Bacteroidales bacterium]
MEQDEFSKLADMCLAPWIAKATALRMIPREIGGNMFRHVMSTMTILIDYHYIYSYLLKAAIIHDLWEDIPDTNILELSTIDNDSQRVILLVSELTRRHGEDKAAFLTRIKRDGTRDAKIIKSADRIQNLTDISEFSNQDFIIRYLSETEKFIYPIVDEVDFNMAIEIRDLVRRKKNFIKKANKLKLFRIF